MRQLITYTLLGTGSSGGVPRVGNQWGACDPANPRNRRRRCSMLVRSQSSHTDQTTLLIDAGADLREQLLSSEVDTLQGVLLTHPHADHIFGLDDLRQLALFLGHNIDVHMDQGTSDIVMRSFGYCFRQAQGSSYPAFCTEKRIELEQPITVDGAGGCLTAVPIDVEHGDIHALGFRIGNVAYLPDIKRIACSRGFRQLQNLSVLILDALRYKTHPSHLSLEESLALIDQLQPGRAILTNMHSDMDYDTLCDTLPAGVEPGYDGMTITEEFAGETNG